MLILHVCIYHIFWPTFIDILFLFFLNILHSPSLIISNKYCILIFDFQKRLEYCIDTFTNYLPLLYEHFYLILSLIKWQIVKLIVKLKFSSFETFCICSTDFPHIILYCMKYIYRLREDSNRTGWYCRCWYVRSLPKKTMKWACFLYFYFHQICAVSSWNL